MIRSLRLTARNEAPSGGSVLALSATRFLTGTTTDALLDAIIAPAGWIATIVSGSDSGGRVKVSGRQLQAAMAVSAYATGTAKLRAVSADGRGAVEKTFDLTVAPSAGGGVLGPTTAAFTAGATSGTLIAAITGLASGETIETVAPNDGRLALDGTRRNLIVGLTAATAGAIAATLTTSVGRTLTMSLTAEAGGGAGTGIFRAAGEGTRLAYTLGGGTALAFGNRKRYRIAVPFRRIKLVWSTFAPTGANNADTDIVAAFNVQAAIEQVITPGLTGIPPRNPTLYGGAKTGAYDPVTGPFPAIVSDAYDFGADQAAGTEFAIWTTFEWVGASPGSGKVPNNAVAGSSLFSNLFERSTSTAASLVASDWAASVADISSGVYAAGPAAVIAPMILVDMGAGTKSTLIIGDSITQSVAEGFNGSGTVGDTRGDRYGRLAWAERYLGGRLNLPYANISKATDRAQHHVTLANTARRRALAAILNPTGILYALSHNDFAGGRSAAQLAADTHADIAAFRAAIGSNVPWIACTGTPFTTGAWTAADGSDQTLVAGISGPGSTQFANFHNNYVRNGAMGQAGFLEVGAQVEIGAPDSGKWLGDGVTPKLYCTDGTHPTSDAALRIANGLPASLPGL